jgi:hypothetical protein
VKPRHPTWITWRNKTRQIREKARSSGLFFASGLSRLPIGAVGFQLRGVDPNFTKSIAERIDLDNLFLGNSRNIELKSD